MINLLVAFFTSFIATIAIIQTQTFHGSFTGDKNFKGPQKFHLIAVPRIGGLAVGLGIFAAIVTNYLQNPDEIKKFLLLICALPVFGIGLTEDLTKKISIRFRLLFTAFGALLACLLLNCQIYSLNILGIDWLLSFQIISIAFTIFSITGLSNAYNIIDGFNGLSSMVGILTLIALAYIGFKFNDSTVISLSLTMASAILGFFLFNYPRGLIFLGDGGAYLIGFWVASLSILLTSQHTEISPWFALMINAYPVIETLFSIYRRKVHQGKSPGHPDGIHFHSLIYRRILNSKFTQLEHEPIDINAKTSPYLWVLSTLAIIPAILFPHSSPILISFFIVFSLLYLWLYKKIVTFKTPKWMHWLS